MLFTPEKYPGITPEACAFFNTPVEQCDPELVRVALVLFALYLSERVPPELGLDAKALFSKLCGRLGADPGEAWPDAAPDEPRPDAMPAAQPDAPPPAPQGAAPNAAPTLPNQARCAEPADAAVTATANATDAANVLVAADLPATGIPIVAAITGAATEPTPHEASPAAPLFRRPLSPRDRDRWFPRRRCLSGRRAPRLRRRPDAPRRPLARWTSYAACAGPP